MNTKFLIKSFYKITIIPIIFLLSYENSFGIETGCGGKEGKEKYDCQIENFCEKYKTDDIHYKTEEYYDHNDDFELAKKKYRENQNGIYSCAIIKIQENSLDIIKTKLSRIDKTGTLQSRIDNKIDTKMTKLKSISKQRKCIFPSNQEENENPIYFKHLLLKESSYEFCKYNYYLSYLKTYYEDINKANKQYLSYSNTHTTGQVSSLQYKIRNDIVNEEIHSQKIFNTVFSTYIDYENNYPVHLLLELIKEDFIVFRRKLHEAISPLSQVVYKISNAMSIH